MLLRLLLLAAVLLMPFGMASANAATNHHSAPAAMQHCPDPAPGQDMTGGIVGCTMACSAALPASGLPQDGPRLIVCAPTEAAAARILHGLHPDTATPPPKRS